MSLFLLLDINATEINKEYGDGKELYLKVGKRNILNTNDKKKADVYSKEKATIFSTVNKNLKMIEVDFPLTKNNKMFKRIWRQQRNVIN